MPSHQKIRAGFVSPGWPLSQLPSGIVSYIENILLGFKENTNDNIEPVILAGDLGCEEVDDYLIDIARFTNKPHFVKTITDKLLHKVNLPVTQSIKYQRFLSAEANKINLAMKQLPTPIDILEIEESFGFARTMTKQFKLPVVTRLHGPWFIHGPIMRLAEQSIYQTRLLNEGEAIKVSHGITSPSVDVLEKTREFYNIDLPNAQVIPNPVCAVDLVNQWQYNNSNQPSILVVGRFDLHKGGDLALLAFRIIALKNKEVMLNFIGPDRGVDIEGKLLNMHDFIQKFVPEEHVKKRIHFRGHCTAEQISVCRKHALVTVFPSRYENFPLSLLEALATGCPTVATPVGGIKEILINDFNGLMAEPESPESMAEKVLSLIDDPVKMQRVSQNAINDTRKRFSPKVVAQQTANFYRTVLANK